MKRILSVLTFAAAVAFPTLAHADPAVIAIIEDRAAAHGAAAGPLIALSWCESRHRADAVGDGGLSLGAFQIHRDGLYRHFLAQGYSDRMNVFEAADYVARVATGQFPGITMRHWSCWGRS